MRTTDANAPNSTGQSETPAGSSCTSASASCATDNSPGDSGVAYRAAREGREKQTDDDDGERRRSKRTCAERRHDEIRIIEGEAGEDAYGDGPQFADAVADAREQERQDRRSRSEDESARCQRRPEVAFYEPEQPTWQVAVPHHQ